MNETIRAFIAIELPKQIISDISQIQEKLKIHKFDIRWTKSESIHLTLKFLGDIKLSEKDNIGKIISQTFIGISPFSLYSSCIGAFPNIKHPKVVWTGIKGQTDILINAQKNLDNNLEALGFFKEERPFQAHLTLGRVKDKIDSKVLEDVIKDLENFETQSFIVNEIILFKSDLKRDGSIYTKLKTMEIK